MLRQPISLTSPMYEEIEKKIIDSFGADICILFIDEIINEPLRELYEEQRRNMSVVPNEKWGFHGTEHRYIDLIAKNGFDVTKNRVSAYGKGTYFSVDAGYAFNYMKSKDFDETSYMFYSQVLIGVTGVDNLLGPRMYVAKYNYGAYPTYIIGIHKEQTTEMKQQKRAERRMHTKYTQNALKKLMK